ncbi:MAG: acyloxyacyl hydrolase [Bacteroidetes bacterium]|nr:acyloxyacyl hydrolase [Bacteroidota bacterium]
MKRVLIIFMFVQHGLYAQADSVIHDFSFTAQQATIWTERSSLQVFTRDHPWFLQLDWGISRNTSKAWKYCNCHIRNGLSAGYINFANSQQLGQAVTVSAFTEPYLIYTGRFRFSIRGSTGLVFLNKVYDSLTNPAAIFFSTKLSFLLALSMNVSYRLSEYFWVAGGVQFNHLSNGGRKDPNEGMNFIAPTLSLNYLLTNPSIFKRPKTKYRDTMLGLMLHSFGNRHKVQATPVYREESSIVAGINIGLIKRVGRLTGLGIGGEYYYDGVNQIYQQRYNQSLQTGIGSVSLQHYLFLGKLLFGQQLAWYVTPNTGNPQATYQRYWLEYEIQKYWYAGFSLKAHGDHSDYFAFSVGHIVKLSR